MPLDPARASLREAVEIARLAGTETLLSRAEVTDGLLQLLSETTKIRC